MIDCFYQIGDTPLFVAVRVNCTQAIKDLLHTSQADQDVRSGRTVSDVTLSGNLLSLILTSLKKTKQNQASSRRTSRLLEPITVRYKTTH